ncbi:MAG: HAD-IC family P-type ATPase, partial [Casimicrobiaceae bacterium]
ITLAAATFVILAAHGETSVAIERTVALLVVTCPCALALAAPLARARAFAAALQAGALLRRADALTRLARVTDVVFDKTGTLTEPARPVLRVLDPAFGEAALIHLIARIERAANHPLAETFRVLAERVPPPEADVLHQLDSAEWLPGEGVQARLAGAIWRFGRPRFALAGEQDVVGNGSDLVLSRDGRPIAVVSYVDRTLPEAASTIKALGRQVRTHLLSGDHAERVESLRQVLSLASAAGGLSAEAKAQAIARMQAEGARVAMVGDGSNDAIALARADVSIAVGAATDHARGSADILLIGPTLAVLPRLMRLARQSERIVLQNLLWAGLYNAVMIPSAMLGWINPIVAATGMAASSALVTLNALRVRMATPETARVNPGS